MTEFYVVVISSPTMIENLGSHLLKHIKAWRLLTHCINTCLVYISLICVKYSLCYNSRYNYYHQKKTKYKTKQNDKKERHVAIVKCIILFP